MSQINTLRRWKNAPTKLRDGTWKVFDNGSPRYEVVYNRRKMEPIGSLSPDLLQKMAKKKNKADENGVTAISEMKRNSIDI